MPADAGRLLAALAERLGSGRLVWRRLPDGTGVVLDADRLTTSSLSVQGLRIVELITAGFDDLDALTDHLAERLATDPGRIRADLEAFTIDLACRLKLTQSD